MNLIRQYFCSVKECQMFPRQELANLNITIPICHYSVIDIVYSLFTRCLTLFLKTLFIPVILHTVVPHYLPQSFKYTLKTVFALKLTHFFTFFHILFISFQHSTTDILPISSFSIITVFSNKHVSSAIRNFLNLYFICNRNKHYTTKDYE